MIGLDPEPGWVTWLERAGVVAPGLAALLLVFRRVRQFMRERVWRPIRDSFMTRNAVRKEVIDEIKKFRTDVTRQIELSSRAIIGEIRLVIEQERRAADKLVVALQGLSSRVAVVEAVQQVMADADTSTGHFRCDENGGNIWTSRVMLRWLRCDQREMQGYEWVNIVHPEERADVQRKWAEARQQHRSFAETIRMGGIERDANGDRVWHKYEVVADPVPDAPPPLAWAGWCRPLKLKDRRVEPAALEA